MQPVPKTPTTPWSWKPTTWQAAAAIPIGVEHSLERLLRHLQAQTRPLSSLEELVITHDGLPAAELDQRLEQAAGRPVRFVTIPGRGRVLLRRRTVASR